MEDTIACISTALGVGAISIIRVSGPDSISIVNKIFKGATLNKCKSHTIHYGYIVDNNVEVDEVLVSLFKAPKTFTREDIIEINCHGGIAVTNQILKLVLDNGARLAMPGEFTKRAFLNGRIDLVYAEGVMDMINAKTSVASTLAMKQLDGNLSNYIKVLRNKILELLAAIEVNIDYPEYDDAVEITQEFLKPKVRELLTDIKHLIATSNSGQIIKNGIKIALIGRPNVGKSSIMNKLIGEDKAIVTDIQGTTRDIIETAFSLDGILINLYDTAGIRVTNDIIEQIGVQRSLALLEQVDLILMIIDGGMPLTEEDFEILSLVKDQPLLVVVNKNDLNKSQAIEKLKEYSVVSTNTVQSDGLKALTDKIKELFNFDKINTGDFTYISNARQLSLLNDAHKYLLNASSSCDQLVPVDMIEIDLKSCWESLGLIIGETYSDELIDQLFSQFCVGK